MNKKERKKIKSIKLKNKKLVKKYPWLKPYNVWTGRVWKDYDYETTWYDDIPKGWQIAFGDMLLAEIDKTSNGDITFQQIKEKFGELRIYASCNKATQDVIHKYEHISNNICIKCGRPNVPQTTNGWIMPICKKCWERNKWHKNHCYEDSVDMEYSNIETEIKWTQFSSEGKTEHTRDISDTVNKIVEKWDKKHNKRRNA